MFAIDVRTAFLFIGLLYFLLPTVTWFVLATQRSPQVVLWCGGGLLVGGAVILAGLYGKVPEWATVSLANLILLIAHLARIQSLRLDLGKPWRMRWMLAAVLIFMLVFEFLNYGLQDYLLRARLSSATSFGLVTYIVILAWRIGHNENSRSAQWIAGVYALVAMSMLFRFFSIQSTGSSILTDGSTAKVVAFVLLLSSVIGHFGYVGLALDRSMRRELKAAADLARDEENHRLGAQIAQLDRQRSLGEMSASLGHELNQPLTAILSNAQVAKRGLEMGRFDSEQVNEFLDKIIANTKRASQIIERIRGFIRPTTVHRKQVDLNLLIHDVAMLVADEADRHKVALTLPPANQSLSISADPIQISQIILNVIHNAIQAVMQSPLRKISVELTYQDEMAIVRIFDSGPGLAPEVLSHIGKPFFTTKVEGLGMGLSISRSIAEQHGGKLTLANGDNGGAVVTLTLPAISPGVVQ